MLIYDCETLEQRSERSRGHIASILAALGINDVSTLSRDDVHINFAVKWIDVSTQFVKFVHTLADADPFAFRFMPLVESDLSRLAHPDYKELVVNFASGIFQATEPVNITETIQSLLQEPHVIIRRIAIRAITDHYSYENREAEAAQKILSSLLIWLELIDKIDAEVLGWVKAAIKYIGEVPGYGLTLSRCIKALLKHAPKTPRLVGEIYLEIPQRILRDLQREPAAPLWGVQLGKRHQNRYGAHRTLERCRHLARLT